MSNKGDRPLTRKNSGLNSVKHGIMQQHQQDGKLGDRPERGRQKVSDKIVNISEIKPGGKVLDIATCI